MDKPQPKRETAISTINRAAFYIGFYASQDALQDFQEFGQIHTNNAPAYGIFVDARYDFDEVLAYIRDYESSPIPDAFKDA